MNELKYYQNQNNLQAATLVKDNIVYAVLHTILQYNCVDIYTNNESVIICYSSSPYPIWVWCKDTKNKHDIISIANCLKNNYLLKKCCNIILSNDLLDELKKLDNIYNCLILRMELLAYKVNSIANINYQCDGNLRLADYSDLDILATLIKNASCEMEGHFFSLEESKEKAIKHLENSELYVWINNENHIVTMASKSIEGKYAKISLVYTIPEYRRKGYAINLVYNITKILLNNNLIPILYTNGSYKASNECYKKIGYIQVGKLFNVENKIS